MHTHLNFLMSINTLVLVCSQFCQYTDVFVLWYYYKYKYADTIICPAVNYALRNNLAHYWNENINPKSSIALYYDVIIELAVFT